MVTKEVFLVIETGTAAVGLASSSSPPNSQPIANAEDFPLVESAAAEVLAQTTPASLLMIPPNPHPVVWRGENQVPLE